MSQITGNIVIKAAKSNPDIEGHVIASALAIVAGGIICFIGLARCGWIVDLISLTSISAFMTGSSLNIAMGQIPGLLGITGFSTRQSTYLVFIDTIKHLGRSNLNAAMGITPLFLLYFIRWICAYLARKFPKKQKLYFFLSTLRTVFIILLYTLISYLVNRHHRATKENKFKILGDVPRGFKNAGVPKVNSTIIKAFASELPASVIVLLIEHIAISKSFGRVNNYIINPSQELVAIGVSNLLGPFLGAYPATGSFSRTAIKSKAGVRTPFAGFITAIVVLLAIYALPAVFFYIPNATLAAVIIHAVGDLITPPKTLYQFWLVSPIEVFIFFVGVIVTVFETIEIGIYCTISISAAVLIFRVLKAKGRFLGKVQVHSVVGDHLLGDTHNIGENRLSSDKYGTVSGRGDSQGKGDSRLQTRNVFLPLDHKDGSNPEVHIEAPYPGIFIYRFSEGFNYPNANHYLDHLTNHIFAHTNRTNLNSYPRPGDRPWNDPGPRRGKLPVLRPELPNLRAVILDFSSVNNVDITSVQQLIDVRNQLDRYTSPDRVDWHFTSINNRWTKRALASAGFGYPNPPSYSPDSGENDLSHWKPIFSVAGIGGSSSAEQFAENQEKLKHDKTKVRSRGTGGIDDTIENAKDEGGNGGGESSRSSSDEITRTKAKNSHGGHGGQQLKLVHGLNRPLFHTDLTNALESAITNVQARDAFEAKGGKGIGAEP